MTMYHRIGPDGEQIGQVDCDGTHCTYTSPPDYTKTRRSHAILDDARDHRERIAEGWQLAPPGGKDLCPTCVSGIELDGMRLEGRRIERRARALAAADGHAWEHLSPHGSQRWPEPSHTVYRRRARQELDR